MSSIENLLDNTHRSMIRALLTCLGDATKVTIYNIGPMPTLQAVRRTSGERLEGSDEIVWGVPTASDYAYPGKSWEEYKDRPDHVLEAMGWCVEKQESWTAENPFDDVRSVRKQLRGEPEDFYHMEPVLVKKTDLYGADTACLEYPLDFQGKRIWQDTEFVVAAVIKIHFRPFTIRRDDRSTKIIRELSRSLGTELLSLYLHEDLLTAQKDFARQRLESCQELAHELRNTMIKFGFVFSVVNAQIGMIRQAWEEELRKAFPDLEWKQALLDRLSRLIRSKLPLRDAGGALTRQCEALLAAQEELALHSLLPAQEQSWLMNRIWPKWRKLMEGSSVWEREQAEISGLLEKLKRSLALGQDPDLAGRIGHIPRSLVEEWVRLSYVDFTADRLRLLDDLLRFLENPALPVARRLQIRKSLQSLKVLVEIIPEMEEKANRMIQSLRYGNNVEKGIAGGRCEIPACDSCSALPEGSILSD